MGNSVLLVGSGPSAARWRDMLRAEDYAYICCYNGSWQCGIPYTHYFCCDPNAIDYTWFGEGVAACGKTVVVTPYLFDKAKLYARPGTEVLRIELQFFNDDHPLEVHLAEPPRKVLFTTGHAGTAIQNAMHFMAYEPDVDLIDLLGTEGRLDWRMGEPYLHFYDKEPMTAKDYQLHAGTYAQFAEWNQKVMLALLRARAKHDNPLRIRSLA